MGVCLSLKSIKFNVKEESSIMKADETKRKREILLGINPCIYGLNYHDPAVVVLIDGTLMELVGLSISITGVYWILTHYTVMILVTSFILTAA